MTGDKRAPFILSFKFISWVVVTIKVPYSPDLLFTKLFSLLLRKVRVDENYVKLTIKNLCRQRLKIRRHHSYSIINLLQGLL
jgi:hypothetical protein